MTISSNHDVKGWCPTAQRPMAAGDGLLVRVNPPLGRVSSRQLSRLAALSNTYGNGAIDLTRRAALQIRGVEEDGYPELLAELQSLGLVESTEIFSNIVLTPFRSEDYVEDILWREISDHLSGVPGLPSKFGVVLDTGVSRCLKKTPGDVRVERSSDRGLVVRLDGCENGRIIDTDKIADFILDVARWFSQSSGVVNGRGRIAQYLNSGASIPSELSPNASPSPSQISVNPGLYEQGCIIAFPFGRATSEHLEQIALFDCSVILTPWRMLLLEGFHKTPGIEGIIVDNSNLLFVDACTGAPACFQAKQRTRDVAIQLADVLLPGQSLHLSGCTKGCARSSAADYTFVGAEGGFDLVKNGRADDPPVKRNIALDRVLNELEACNDL